MWRNWQTRRSQKPVMVTSWRFKSSHPHHKTEASREARLFICVRSPRVSKGCLSKVALPNGRASDTLCYDRRFNFPPTRTPMALIIGKVNGVQVGQYAFCAASIGGTLAGLTNLEFAWAFITVGIANNIPNTTTTI